MKIRLGLMSVLKCPMCGDLVTEYTVAEHQTRHEQEKKSDRT